ncbi:hypothetical protein J6590_005493 [Homalodisca vitripennis]|nr:hypothetical protein J6590_005493 [Homalodisca vitripennis]
MRIEGRMIRLSARKTSRQLSRLPSPQMIRIFRFCNFTHFQHVFLGEREQLEVDPDQRTALLSADQEPRILLDYAVMVRLTALPSADLPHKLALVSSSHAGCWRASHIC